MEIHFDEIKTDRNFDFESQIPASGGVSAVTSQDSLESMESSDAGVGSDTNTFTNSFISSLLSSIDSSLISIGIKPKPSNDRKLKIAICAAIQSNGKSLEALETIIGLIEAGADASAKVELDDFPKSIFYWIVLFYQYEPWQKLLPIAIKKVSQGEIHDSLKIALMRALDEPNKKCWIEAARILISTSTTPCNDLTIWALVEDKEKGNWTNQEKSLEAWDREKNWDLFPKAMI
ncbi:MAG TPA: hypothetical protein VLG76_04145 [Rhabdochlamydiaceae bacterium]|nr:hypothetical protein [Rhabdochlamydiaceae bacterium]